jgi:hypothetical protein
VEYGESESAGIDRRLVEFEDVMEEVFEQVAAPYSPPTGPFGSPRPGNGGTDLARAPSAAIPSKSALAAARQFWTKVIRRCGEPVPGTKGEFQPRPAESAESATFRVFVVDFPRTIPNCVRLVTTDPRVLILFRCSPAESVPRHAQGNGTADPGGWETLVTTPVPWTAISSLEVVSYRRTTPTAAAG